MPRSFSKSKVLSSVCVLLISIVLSACQASEKQVQCCQLRYGLLRVSDLSGTWRLIESSDLITEPSVSRYKQVPPQEYARQYLSGNSGEQKGQITIIHDIRLYKESAPSLGKLDYKPGIPLTIPNLLLDEATSQVQCLSQDPADANSLSFCAVESRYDRILSTMYFYFDTSTSSTGVATSINEAFAHTDARIREIAQYWAEINK